MLDNYARNPGLTEAGRRAALESCGSPTLSAHERLERARKAPEGLRVQAKELHDEGVCQYVESAIQLTPETASYAVRNAWAFRISLATTSCVGVPRRSLASGCRAYVATCVRRVSGQEASRSRSVQA